MLLYLCNTYKATAQYILNLSLILDTSFYTCSYLHFFFYPNRAGAI